MKVLLVSATPFEIQPLRASLNEHFERISDYYFKKNKLEIQLLITGVGMTYTAFALGNALARQPYDLAVNAGIAGAFNRELEPGAVVHVVSERFADVGVEEADGSFTDVHELGLMDPDLFPFRQGELINEHADAYSFLPKCNGLTVNKVHGSQDSIQAIRRKYRADVETMEGAAFFLACLLSGVPFLEIRAVSNYVEPRNKDAWDIPLAIENLNSMLISLLEALEEQASSR